MSLCFSPTGDADSRKGAFQSLVPAGAVLHQHIVGRDTLSSGVCGIVSDGELLVDWTTRRNESYNILHGGQHSCQLDSTSMGFLHRCYYADQGECLFPAVSHNSEHSWSFAIQIIKFTGLSNSVIRFQDTDSALFFSFFYVLFFFLQTCTVFTDIH